MQLGTPHQAAGDVVTLNGDQQRLIENQARRSDPSLEAHFDRVVAAMQQCRTRRRLGLALIRSCRASLTRSVVAGPRQSRRPRPDCTWR
jgi:hypothetical protein